MIGIGCSLDKHRAAPTGGAVAWAPTDVAGLTLWLKGDAGITEVGGAISSWVSQEGSAYDFAQLTGSKQPTLETGWDTDGVAGDAIDDELNCATGPDFAGIFDIYIVSKYPTADARAWIGSSDDYLRWKTSLTLQLYITSTGQNFTSVSAGGSYKLLRVTRDGSNVVAAYENGSALTGSGTKAGTFSITSLLSQSGGSFANATLYEILVYNSILTGDDYTNLYAYLDGRFPSLSLP